MNSTTPSESNAKAKATGFEWQNHLGLFVGLAASILICLKLLAVAKWNSTTAFGILAVGGTANVLTGSLLGGLPLLYGAFAFIAVPRIERILARRSPVERAAARQLEYFSAVPLVLIVPVGLLLTFLAFLAFSWLYQHCRARRHAKKGRTHVANRDEAPSRFELVSVLLAAGVIVFFGSLPMPWFPPETVVTSDGELTGYVLRDEGDTATVLLADDRVLIRVQADAVAGEYCEGNRSWWIKPIWGLIAADDKYPDCPS
jgi:hypothetical protein